MDLSGSDRLPLLSPLTQCLCLDRAVIQGCWIEVCTVRPNQCVNLRVDSNAVKKVHVVKRPIQFTRQDRSEVDGLSGAIVETNLERMRRHDLETQQRDK